MPVTMLDMPASLIPPPQAPPQPLVVGKSHLQAWLHTHLVGGQEEGEGKILIMSD